MKFTDPRISARSEDDKLIIDIKAFFVSSKQSMLFFWMMAWSFCGAYAISQYFVIDNQRDRLMIIIYAAFWAYFEYKVVHAFRWRKWGREQIIIEKDRMSITRLIGERGMPRYYDLEYIKNIGPLKTNERNFFHSMNSGYWNVGDEKMSFEYKGKVIPFGMHLDEKNVRELTKKIKHEVQDRVKN